MALNRLVLEYLQREDGARQMGEEIARAGSATVVALIDLASSTEMKYGATPAVWLGYVQRFFERIEGQLGEGRIVKRLGDELMLDFGSAEACEEFFARIHRDSLFSDFPARAAVDFGVCYHLRFAEGTEDDPYGMPVDRCARIARLAQPGTVLCGADFVAESRAMELYFDLGSFALKGIPDPQRLYLYQPADSSPNASYLEPLLERLQSEDLRYEGYRFASRSLTAGEFGLQRGRYSGRPFLLRELLRVPKLPFDAAELLQRVKQRHFPNPINDYVGYLVEWRGALDSFAEGLRGSYIAYITFPSWDMMPPTASVALTPEMYEAVRSIQPGQAVSIRGIIMGSTASIISLDYADIVLE